MVFVACGESVSEPVAATTVRLDRTSIPLGGPFTMSFQFVVSPDLQPLNEDYRVMVHFLDSNGELMWADDHDPVTPTTQWQPGQTISYSRRSRVPMYPYIGDVVVAVGLYSGTTGERLPLTGEHLGQRAYGAGVVTLQPQSESSFVMYQDGWHEDEFDPDSGRHWRWTTGQADLSFRNPGTDAVLYLELGSRPELFETPQRVALRLGDETVYETTVDTSEPQFHEVPLSALQLQESETVTLELVVDFTFEPAAIAAASSDDQRSLGVRVFYAFLEPH